MSQLPGNSENDLKTTHIGDGSSGVSLVDRISAIIISMPFLQSVPQVSTDSGLTDDERVVRK